MQAMRALGGLSGLVSTPGAGAGGNATFQDTFNRGYSPLGTSSDGTQSWTENPVMLPGTGFITVNNQASVWQFAGGLQVAYVDLLASTGRFKLTLGTVPGLMAPFYVLGRYANTANHLGVEIHETGSSYSVTLFKRVDNVRTELRTQTVEFVGLQVGDTFELEVTPANVIRMYQNGMQLQADVSDAAGSMNTRWGIGVDGSGYEGSGWDGGIDQVDWLFVG